MLVLTPRPHPTECVSGYLHRLSSVNGYSSPSWIIEPYRNGYHADDYRRITVATMQKIAGLSEPEADRVCVRPSREGSRSTMRLVGVELHASHVDMRAFRVCPVCVAEHGRHEAFWHLEMVQWCPVHRTPLLDECRDCGATLRWKRPSIVRCNCGADLTRQSGEGRCPKPLADLLLVVRAALYRDVESIAARPQRLTQLFHLDLYRLMRLVETLEEVVCVRDSRGAIADSEIDPMIEIANILANWPRNFQVFLQNRYGEELENDSSRRSFKLTFPWAFWTLGRNLKENAHQLDFLRDEVLRFGAAHWTQERLTRVGPRAALYGLQCEWGSVPDAASLIGLDPRTLLKQIREGLVPIKQSDTVLGNRNYQVSLDWARKTKYSSQPSMSVRDAAKFIGVPTRVLIRLRTARVYKVRHLTRRSGGYSVEDAGALKQLLHERAMKYGTDG
jgi:hypothetical protein